VRCGRKRLNGHREVNGRLLRIKAAERDPLMVEKLQVLAQPHRRGDLDQLVESPLGRFVLRNKLHRVLYDLANRVERLVGDDLVACRQRGGSSK